MNRFRKLGSPEEASGMELLERKTIDVNVSMDSDRNQQWLNAAIENNAPPGTEAVLLGERTTKAGDPRDHYEIDYYK